MPVHFQHPAYYVAKPSVLPFVADKYLSLALPIIAYWAVSAWFMFLDAMQFPFFEKYRLHESSEVTKRNRVSASKVATMVVLQQLIQTGFGLFILEDEATSRAQVFDDHEGNVHRLAEKVVRMTASVLGGPRAVRMLTAIGPLFANWLYWWGIPALQLFWAFLVMDAWEYTLHRAFHESRWLYNNFHSHHHRLYVPYAFGALYNHPIEGLLLDSAGAGVAHAASFMTVRQGIVLFTFSTIKTVCDHGGYAFPPWLDPLHLIFPNTAEYHDVHHQMQGLRYNYSQPFFVHFDVLFGTRMSAEKFAKMREVNKRYKESNKTSATDDISPTASATAIDQKAANGTAKRRGQSDRSASALAKEQSDPTVVRDGDDYRAKAGVRI
ncbi:hypothetical protein IEQ34_025193 [Dendrobium chrysotoxum]|uniref:aldehyde oxygenase (deformylating) n=1 Tax=Dendrobium chrysotoxum TaxID=161865 RepID=A0AAV7FQJ3_DENCH|nr:hypothetical protein IEQ34_025193 [Dendrobium chrysotoxum]